MTRYLSLTPASAVVAPSQPSPYYDFHRPLSQLLGACVAAGFALDGMEEPAFEPNAAARDPLGWARCTQIPPILVGRLRVR